MTLDLTKLILHTGYNSFKNSSVQRGNLTLPTSLNTSNFHTSTLVFTLTEPASFIQAYKYSSDYGDYFNYLDSAYHDAWRQVNVNDDDLIFTSAGLYYYNIYMKLVGNVVTFTLFAPKSTSGTPTVTHPTYLVPVTFVEYRLAN